MRSRAFRLRTRWLIDDERQRCWEFLTAPGQRWRDWWPRLQEIHVDRADDLVGSEARCVWRSPIGYRVRTDLKLVDVVAEKRVELSVRGDVTGGAVVEFAAGSSGGTLIDVALELTPAARWMRLTTPVLRPLFMFGHRVVMRGGERGMNAVLVGRRAVD
ncbi:hypothetical protein [Phytoactinopolyspora halotolerans]|uniref:Polyketide cyclase n=1 Tax=Phytoactinopolyspora halotolerans TaxID=1981512 RepID=A0A6L9SAZ2_9ACTN|nr:hypothetical protein [Phytoactinopolyspora halotolerans]NEE01784.1 hypothetical protein [Phytoactinopolyspora halotolerans]